jgi:hypothetical protein
MDQALSKQPGDQQEHRASRNLDANQARADHPAVSCPEVAARIVLQRGLRIRADDRQRRHQSRQERRCNGHSGREQQHRHVDVHVRQSGKIDRGALAKQSYSGNRQQHAAHGPGGGQEEALGKGRCEQARSSRAKRDPHRAVAPASQCASDLRVCQIHTREQHETRHRRHEQPQSHLRVLDHDILHRLDGDLQPPSPSIGGRRRHLPSKEDLGLDRGKLRLGLAD